MRLAIVLGLLAVVSAAPPSSNSTHSNHNSNTRTSTSISTSTSSSVSKSNSSSSSNILSILGPVPKRPSQDPFYKPREGYESLQLGDIIDSRKVNESYGIFAIVKENLESAYQLLVRSEDSHGNPTAVVTTILIPYNASWDKVVSYQPAQDSPCGDCAPSYAIFERSDPSTWITPQTEEALFLPLMFEGVIINVPDYNGPQNAFLAGIQGGHGTLDSLRGVANSHNITGIDPDAKMVVWGYSGGSHPTTWAAALQPTYAPDLNLVGIAAGGVVVDVLQAAKSKSGGFAMGLVVAGIVGIGNEYPEFKQYFEDNLYPDKVSEFYASANRCLVGNLLHYFFAQWSSYSSKGSSILDDPIVQNVTDQFFLMKQDYYPDVPVFFYSAKYDEVVSSSNDINLYNRWCEAGVSVELRLDYVSEHITQIVTGAPDAIMWIRNRLNGVPQTGCNRTTSITNLDNPGAWPEFKVMLDDLGDTFDGKEIGPV